ncbi:MAG: hypothetical protein GEU74_12135 [Nitriliruptorales bacterium]|nr:hypothetical protein [Nitriliruptorales bacterium]
MIESDFWLDEEGARRSVVDLRAARCPRCPQPIREVPVDKAWIVHYPGERGHVRIFVCPHCRIETQERIEQIEALRLFAAGVGVRRTKPAVRSEELSEDDLIEFGRALAHQQDLARMALEA